MKNIIIAIDFSEHTENIIKSIENIAKATSSQVWLIHVAAPEPDFIGYETGPQTERNHIAFRFREEHRQLQQLGEKLRSSGIENTALLLQGSTIETIINEAKKLKADLIVVGSHGKSGLYKTLVGSISEGVIKQANCPVLVIPTRKL